MCGIVGIVGTSAVNQRIYDALTVLQHRGQDAAGIMTMDENALFVRKDTGLVRDVFGDVRRVVDCEAIGQLRPVDYQFWSCAEMHRLRTFRTKARAATARMFADLAVAVRAFSR